MNRHIAPIVPSPASPTRADDVPARIPSLLVVRERRGDHYVITLYYVGSDGPTWISGLSEQVATSVLRTLRRQGCFILAGYHTRRRLGMERAA